MILRRYAKQADSCRAPYGLRIDPPTNAAPEATPPESTGGGNVHYLFFVRNMFFSLPSPKAFFPRLEQREGFTTKCFGVEFENGTSGSFSLDKALSAVAN